MDRNHFHHPPERHYGLTHTAPPPSSQPFPPPTAQPPIHIPFSDPFHSNRDPFLPGGSRRSSLGLSSKAWPHPQANAIANSHHHQLSPPSTSTQPPPPNGMMMASPFDPSRRRSLGAAGSPPQYVRGQPSNAQTYVKLSQARSLTLVSMTGPLEPPPPPPSFPARNMPPPSPPQNPPSSTLHLGSAPRGPPTASPFLGVRDLASHRPGMSISAILGGNEDRRTIGSPHSAAIAPSATPKSIQPPSPGRARSSSMREGGDRRMPGASPPRAGVFAEPARTGSEPRREGVHGSPQFRRDIGPGFRVFQGSAPEQVNILNGHTAPMRPTSQPADFVGSRTTDEGFRREDLAEVKSGSFRNFGELTAPVRSDAMHRVERQGYQNGITSHPQERTVFSSPQTDRDARAQVPIRYSGAFGSPVREEHAASFRPGFPPTSHPVSDAPRDLAESRAHEMRRQSSRPSPPPGETLGYERKRNGYFDRQMTSDDHQRIEGIHRDTNRKESEGSIHRVLLNISPELDRKGRNSPLPQAVQGAQPRHIGPGGDNPGIKVEFGRMFSGLGSGVGSTPNPVNGTTTPSRMSPSGQLDSGELARSAVPDAEDRRGVAKTGARRNGRRSRDDGVRLDNEGRNTPDLRVSKRAKTNHTAHHHHHHVHPGHHRHHHHHDQADNATPGSFNMLRFPSNPLSAVAAPQTTTHHHHHHHAHPGHHHHHTPRSAPPARRPSTTILSTSVVHDCASKPRKHLGSQLYATELSRPPVETPSDAKIKFSSKMKPIPVFQGKENCTFTVRVPRYYLVPSDAGRQDRYSLEEICKRRQIWGTDVYTDDSDVVAAAVHSGWLEGDFGEYNEDLKALEDHSVERETTDGATLSLKERPKQPVKAPTDLEAHITLLILSPLEYYASTNQHHIWSREWDKTHDGMSFMIHSIEFVDEGASSRFIERGGAARKQRIAMEEADRREAAAGLLLFSTGSSTVRVGA